MHPAACAMGAALIGVWRGGSLLHLDNTPTGWRLINASNRKRWWHPAGCLRFNDAHRRRCWAVQCNRVLQLHLWRRGITWSGCTTGSRPGEYILICLASHPGWVRKGPIDGWILQTSNCYRRDTGPWVFLRPILDPHLWISCSQQNLKVAPVTL